MTNSLGNPPHDHCLQLLRRFDYDRDPQVGIQRKHQNGKSFYLIIGVRMFEVEMLRLRAVFDKQTTCILWKTSGRHDIEENISNEYSLEEIAKQGHNISTH